MKIRQITFIIALILFVCCRGFLFSHQINPERKIFQAENSINIDGSLDEWESVEVQAISYSPLGERIEPDPDIKVTARFSFDSNNFYVAVEAEDDLLEFKHRGWRYGDGFILTFVDPYNGDKSERFYSFGISREKEKNIVLLVNKDGNYFPRVQLDDFKVVIEVDQIEKTIIYELGFPLDYLYPFKPFIHQKWGINLIYADSDGSESKILQLEPDIEYDKESSDQRKGAVYEFVHRIPENETEFQCLLNATHYYNDSQKEITVAINSPEKIDDWTIKYIQSYAQGKLSDEKKIDLQKGLNISKFFIPAGEDPSGLHYLSMGVFNEKNRLVHTEDKQYFLLSREEISDFRSEIDKVKESEQYIADIVFRESLPALEIRLKWITEYMEKAQPHAFIQDLVSWHQDSEFLLKNIKEGKPALFPLGRIARLAHRSEIDNTLQPYSVYIPDFYDKKNPLPLVITLHGSGVNEEETILNVARKIVGEGRMNVFVLAPQARGLSDWYLGNSGKDVLECLRHFKQLYNVNDNKIILDGFSMGGYGAWRLSALHPELFKGTIIRSGAIKPPPDLQGENVLELYTSKKELKILIIHGALDQAVPVEDARTMAARLEELGEAYRYIEVKEAGHGDYDKSNEIFKWLRDII